MKKILKHLKKNWFRHGLETLVVIVGVLIAFTLNDWNERMRERHFEQEMLAELYASVQNNIEFLDRAIRRSEEARKSCQLILDHFDNDLAYHDSLDHHFSESLFWFYPSLDNNAYESLKSYGLHLITNDSLREKLGSIYEWKFIERLSLRQEEYFYGTVAPLLVNWFESYDLYGPMKPSDYDALSESSGYKHILRTMISNRTNQIRLFDQSRQERTDLARMIKLELNLN